VVDRFEATAGPPHDRRRGAAGQRDAEAGGEAGADRAVRQAGVLVELDDRGRSVRPDRTLRGAGGGAGLLGMATAELLAARAARAPMDVERTHEGRPRDLGLKRGSDGGVLDGAVAVGALGGEGRVEDFLDRCGPRRRSMPCGPWSVPDVRPGFVGRSFGGLLAKGAAGRLAARSAASRRSCSWRMVCWSWSLVYGCVATC